MVVFFKGLIFKTPECPHLFKFHLDRVIPASFAGVFLRLTPIFVSRLCSTKKSTVLASKPMTNTVFLKNMSLKCSIHGTLNF